VFDQGIGDLFVVRVAGNVAVDDVTLGSIEFAISALHCPLVLVVGHEKCGAVSAAVDAVASGERPGGYLAGLIDPILAAAEGRGLDEAIEENVRRQVAFLARTFSDTTVAGAEYDLHSGQVRLVQ
jgi:carbonic anhydrase